MPAVRHFLQLKDFGRSELEYLFARARVLKARHRSGALYQPLRGRTLAMIFEKNSTRTRVSFEAGMAQLGGSALFLSSRETQLGRGEPIEDVAEVISRMVDAVMIRTFQQDIVERFAAHSRAPVINGLTDEYHPCQILADLFTFMEHRGTMRGKTVAWVGDSNNVCNSWVQAAQIFEFRLHVASPPGYELEPERGPASPRLAPVRTALCALRRLRFCRSASASRRRWRSLAALLPSLISVSLRAETTTTEPRAEDRSSNDDRLTHGRPAIYAYNERRACGPPHSMARNRAPTRDLRRRRIGLVMALSWSCLGLRQAAVAQW